MNLIRTTHHRDRLVRNTLLGGSVALATALTMLPIDAGEAGSAASTAPVGSIVSAVTSDRLPPSKVLRTR